MRDATRANYTYLSTSDTYTVYDATLRVSLGANASIPYTHVARTLRISRVTRKPRKIGFPSNMPDRARMWLLDVPDVADDVFHILLRIVYKAFLGDEIINNFEINNNYK